MILYNVTVKVDWSVSNEWLQWMKQEHIPEVMNTGLFYEYRIMHLLEMDETDGPTYAIQYYAANAEAYHQYINQHAVGFRQKVAVKWGQQVVSFRSVMEIVN